MRTSIDLPDALFRRAKRVALERKTTLKALIASGLEKELGISAREGRHHLLKGPVLLTEDSPLYRSPLVDDPCSDEEEAAKLNEIYRRR
jgi:hypothetical protein